MGVHRELAKLLWARSPEVAKKYDDFENGVGTYLKVVRFSEPTNPDGFIVLYLRSSGTFLLLGYWRGYEQSVVAGRWSKRDDVVKLDGHGETSTDAPPDRTGSYQRDLTATEQNHTPVLVASTELPGWSLLAWTGPFAYMGQGTIVNPDNQWLPRSLAEVDEWIERILAR